jgi:hypothetical protein
VPVTDVADLTALGLHLQQPGFNRDAVGHVPDLHQDVHAGAVADPQREARCGPRFEPLGLRLDRIVADVKIRRHELTGFIT